MKKYLINTQLIVITLCCFSFYARAQEGLMLQLNDINYITNRGSLISSSYSEVTKQFYLDYSNRLGLLSDIRTIYAEGVISLNNKHIVGASVYSEQETSLFRKSRFGLTYGYTINLNSKLKWQLATDINGINIFFDASKSTAGGSAWTLNGNLSTSFIHEKYELAFSYNQIPYQTLTPINYSFQLNTYILAYALYKLELSQNFKWNTGVRIKQADLWSIHFDNHIIYDNRLGVLLSISKYYNIGISFCHETIKTNYMLVLGYQGILAASGPGQSQLNIGILISGKKF